ncbi:MAG: hypothetical protein RL497_2424 [Pseudomonadota bacterium]|jgi:hypothetical protein
MNLLEAPGEKTTGSTRLALYLYSTGNILGCLLALGGLGLFFAGVIDDYWGAIVAGLYLTGVLAIPRRKDDENLSAERFNEDNLLEALENTLKTVGPKLPEKARSGLASIKHTLEGLLPALKSLETSAQLDLHSRLTVMSTITKYLPETLTAYLRLPPAFALVHHGSSGKTAQVLLIEQLDALDTQLKQVAQNAYAQDIERLVANGKFLQDRFG